MKWIVSHKTNDDVVAVDYADDVRFYSGWVTLMDEIGQAFLHLNSNNVIEVRKEKDENKETA